MAKMTIPLLVGTADRTRHTQIDHWFVQVIAEKGSADLVVRVISFWPKVAGTEARRVQIPAWLYLSMQHLKVNLTCPVMAKLLIDPSVSQIPTFLGMRQLQARMRPRLRGGLTLELITRVLEGKTIFLREGVGAQSL